MTRGFLIVRIRDFGIKKTLKCIYSNDSPEIFNSFAASVQIVISTGHPFIHLLMHLIFS